MTSFAIGVPWRGGDPYREQTCSYVSQELAKRFPSVPVIYTDTPGDRFNRAAARNHAVRLLGDHEAVLLLDADTIPEVEPVLEAVAMVGDGALHLPYTEYRELDWDNTIKLMAGAEDAETIPPRFHDCTGGALVTSPYAWWSLGGMDERFTGWGFEDTTFALVANSIGYGIRRHLGEIKHLWHAPEWDIVDPMRHEGELLHARYAAAATREEVQAIVNEHRWADQRGGFTRGCCT